jgi:hypothetical protein
MVRCFRQLRELPRKEKNITVVLPVFNDSRVHCRRMPDIRVGEDLRSVDELRRFAEIDDGACRDIA